MKCVEKNCENFGVDTDNIAMVQTTPTKSYVYQWHETTGLGTNLDKKNNEDYTEHKAEKGRLLPYIYQVECGNCGTILIDFDRGQ